MQIHQKIPLKLVKRVELGRRVLISLNVYVIIYAVEKRERSLDANRCPSGSVKQTGSLPTTRGYRTHSPSAVREWKKTTRQVRKGEI